MIDFRCVHGPWVLFETRKKNFKDFYLFCVLFDWNTSSDMGEFDEFFNCSYICLQREFSDKMHFY